MSFWDIKDPVKRDEIVQDYQRLKRKIREKSENQKASITDQSLFLAKRYAPIVQSQKKMAEEIVKELKKNNQYEDEDVKSEDENEDIKSEDEEGDGSFAEEYRKRYRMRDPDIDTEFGVKFLGDGQAVIGKTPITIDGDDIIIGDEVFPGNESVWELLTEKKKENLVHKPHSKEDLQIYYEILKKTNVLRHNFDPNSNKPRSNQSWKWTHIFAPLWQRMKDENNSSSEEEEEVRRV